MRKLKTKLNFKHIACPVCNATEPKKVYKIPDEQTGLLVSVWKCKCGLHYQNPQLDAEALSKEYETLTHIEKKQQESQLKRYLATIDKDYIREYVRRIAAAKPPQGAKLLDIGCAYGHYVQEAGNQGYDAYGCELTIECLDYARKVLKLPHIDKGLLSDIKYKSKFFDVIMLHHVFEHVPDPHVLLPEIKRILKDDGILIITVPNVNSVRKLHSRKLRFHIPIQHVFHYDVKSVHRLLIKNGYSIISKPVLPKPLNRIKELNTVYENALGDKVGLYFFDLDVFAKKALK
jgi:2-polyprenyl-3-methyl-5-hydroxy-6-metoxy-1,4-benzoquinol methylase